MKDIFENMIIPFVIFCIIYAMVWPEDTSHRLRVLIDTFQ